MTDSHTNSVCQDGSEIASASISETGAVPGDDRVGLTSKQLFVVKAGDGSVYAGELRTEETLGNSSVQISVAFAAELGGESFFSGEVTVGEDGEEVDAHAYQVPYHDWPGDDQYAVVDP